MIKNLIRSVLKVVASENILRSDELQLQGKKTIAEIFNDEKKEETNSENNSTK